MCRSPRSDQIPSLLLWVPGPFSAGVIQESASRLLRFEKLRFRDSFPSQRSYVLISNLLRPIVFQVLRKGKQLAGGSFVLNGSQRRRAIAELEIIGATGMDEWPAFRLADEFIHIPGSILQSGPTERCVWRNSLELGANLDETD